MVSQPELVDSHAHLDRYSDDVVEAMLGRAAEAGVARLLTVGVDVETSRAAIKLATDWGSAICSEDGQRVIWPCVLAAIGIHPTRLASPGAPGDPLDLLRRLHDSEVEDRGQFHLAAIGEVGLDEAAPDPVGQRRFLVRCLGLAGELGIPLVLHVVGGPRTHMGALSIVRMHRHVRVLAHYFVGGPDLAERYLEAGCWISVGKPVTRPAEAAVRAAVPLIPPDRLLLETDTYPLPGRATEPRDVTAVCASVAELTGRSYEDVAASSTAAFDRWLSG